MKRFLVVPALLFCALTATAGVLIDKLQVEYRATPLGIDVAHPRFNWQMATTAGERGYTQAAYQIQVKDSGNNVVWDSPRTENGLSLGIPYAGSPLQPATRYTWTVTVWDQKGAKLTGTSWFETGLMDPAPGSNAWGGAKWVGGASDDLVLYAPYLAIFDVSYALTIAPGSTRASFVYGANDSRLMDQYKNVYQIASGKDQSYIKLELDVSAVDGTPGGKAKLHVYRAGYKDSDSPAQPLRTFDISTDLINQANRNAEHVIQFRSAFGQIAISIDGNSSLTGAAAAQPRGGVSAGGRGGSPNSVNLNPVGQGGDYLAFGMLCDIGFAVEPGQSAAFRNVTVRNNRAPNNILFHEDLAAAPYQGIYADFVKDHSGFSVADGRYVLTGGTGGVFLVRNPSRNSMPMLRTAFKTAKAVLSARLYVTARGIYEVYVNGKRVGDDYYNPGLTQYNISHMYQTYDVTGMIRAGENAIGAMLGEGWWSGLLSYGTAWNHFGDRQSLLAKLAITYKDGSSETIVTNPQTWKYYGAGPVIYSSLDMGEIYDAGRERAVEGWTTAG